MFIVVLFSDYLEEDIRKLFFITFTNCYQMCMSQRWSLFCLYVLF